MSYDTTSVTNLTKNTQRVLWIIENVSQYPEMIKIIGPKFSFWRNLECYLSFSKEGNDPIVCLHNKSSEAIYVEGKTALLNGKGEIMYARNMEVKNITENGHTVLLNYLDGINNEELEYLKDDRLEVECILTALGYVTKSGKNFGSQENVTMMQ